MSRYIDPKKMKLFFGGFMPRVEGYPSFTEYLDEYLAELNGVSLVDTRMTQGENLGAPIRRPNPRKGSMDALSATAGTGRFPACLAGTIVQVRTFADENWGALMGRTDTSTTTVNTLTENRPTVHIVHRLPTGEPWSIIIPLAYLMKTFPLRANGCFGYVHSIHTNVNNRDLDVPVKMYRYHGVSQRNWLVRMREHIRGIERGDRKKFYNVWRQHAGSQLSSYLSEVCVAGLTYPEVMDWEEWAVDTCMAEGTSLNMIPGGFKGIRELHKFGVRGPHRNPTERNKLLKKFERANPQAGVPNPFMSKMWEDETYAEKMICNEKLGRLSPAKIREIRRLNWAGKAPEDIAAAVGASNTEQVQNIIDGKTYTRIF